MVHIKYRAWKKAYKMYLLYELDKIYTNLKEQINGKPKKKVKVIAKL